MVTVRDGNGDVAYSGPTVFLPQNQNFLSFGVVKAPDARPGQIGLEGLFYPTFINIDGEPVNVMGDDRNPTLSMSLYTGDLGMDDGSAQSVYVLDKSNAEQVMKADGTPYRMDLQPGQTAQLPDGLGTVTFEEVVPWNKVQISRTPGKFVALGGVVLALVGLLGSLFIRPRRIWVRARRDDEGTLVEVAALDRSGGGDVSGALAEVVADLREKLVAIGPGGEDVTDAAWETLSNQAVAVCGIVYFLALLSHLVEWSSLRKLPVASEATVSGEASDGGVAVATGPRTSTRTRSGVPRCSAGSASCSPVSRSRCTSWHCSGAAWPPTRTACRGATCTSSRWPGRSSWPRCTSRFYRKFSLAWMAPIVISFVLILLMVDVIWLYDPVAPLTEALYSPWLVIHVVSAIIATGAFTLGGICSALFLVKSRAARKPTGYLARVPEPAVLDRVSYRMHAFGFPVWTFAVLITGPIWAHQAWSSYWNWDPKEVWAFITWVVYAAYLHARSTAGWKGRNAALLALVGLATLWFNFIGINFFSSTSQHSYAAPAVEAPSQAGVVAGVR